MNGIVQLIKNLIYLSKFNLKNTVMSFPYYGLNLQNLIESIEWNCSGDNVKKPKIYNRDETLDVILNSNKSLARFGDGEINIIQGKDIPYQKYDKKLAERLKEILANNQENLMVGINYWYFNYIDYRHLNEFSQNFSLFVMPLCRQELLKYINFDKQYYDASITARELDTIDYYEKFRELWKNKDIVVVACKNAIDALHYNIFDCASHIDYIYVPNVNSFEKYDETLTQIKERDKTKCIMLMAGPLSKVLASDLAGGGYRALDLGHLAKGYDYVKRQIPPNAENTILFNSIDR